MKLERLPKNKLIDFGIEFLQTKGVTKEKAQQVTEIVVENSARRVNRGFNYDNITLRWEIVWYAFTQV